MKRNRFMYAVATCLVIGLGLLSRRCPHLLPAALGKYPGDALWALVVFCGIGFLRPRWPTALAGVAAFMFACTVEFAKWYQAAWIESVRATLPGRLVLGSVFSWKNIVAYATGILIGWVVEAGICHFWKRKRGA
jgi:hypothetical protein